ncbi:unnamed protein product [Caenorhabditis nigoni]
MCTFHILSAVLLFVVLVSGQEEMMDGEKCNDVILYDIIKRASKTTSDPAEIRKTSMDTMQRVFPLARRTIMCLLFLYFLHLLISITDSCKFNVQVRSETDRDVWAQFTFHNKTESEVFQFTKYGQTKNLTITGALCNLAPTVLKSWETFPKKGVNPVGQTSAHLEGIGGTMYYKIFPKDGPAAVRAQGMLCSWGQCRLGK